MKTLLSFMVILLFSGVLYAEDITTVKGKTYSNVTVIRVEPDGISIKHSAGIIKLYLNELTTETRLKYKLENSNAIKYQQAKSISAIEYEKSQYGNWKVSRDRDPITGKEIIVGMLSAENDMEGNLPTLRSYPNLVVRFNGEDLAVYICTETYIGIETIDVTSKIGNDSPRTDSWNISTDFNAIFYPNGGVSSAEFARGLKNGRFLFVRFTPYGKSPVTIKFDTLGIGRILEIIVQNINSIT